MAVAVHSAGERAATTRRTPLRPVDLLLGGYLVVVSLVALVRAPEQPGCWWLLAAHALFAVLLYLITRPGLGPVGRAIRELYPLLLLVGLYSELDVLSGPGTIPVHDATVQQWELAIFGVQLSTEWWRAMPSRFWSAVLHAAYLSYYLIVVAPAFYFVWRRDLPALQHFVLVVMTTFVVCYLVFIFFPVAGPYYVFPRPDAWFTDNSSPAWCITRSPRAAHMARHSPAHTSRPRWPPRSRPHQAPSGSRGPWDFPRHCSRWP